jgi:hypothetical protein
VVSERPGAVALWGRAAVVGLLSTALGILGHVSADGLLPGPAVLVGLAGASVLLGVPVLAREASRLRLVGLTVGGQTFTHVVLAVSAGHRGDAPAGPTSSGGGAAPAPAAPSLPTVDGRRVGSLQDAFQPSGGGSSSHSGGLALPAHLVSDLSDHAPMMVAHLVVAALVGLWLAHGERVFWTLVRTTAGGLLTPVTPYVAPQPSTAARIGVPPDAPAFLPELSDGAARAVSRRGPPVLAVA